MTDIAQLAAQFDTLETELHQVQAQQVGTPTGTAQWWELQRSIADVRTRKNTAEVAYLEARLTLPGNKVEIENRLYFLRRELAPPKQYPQSQKVVIYHPDDPRHPANETR